MATKEQKAKLGLPEDATDEQVDAKLEELSAAATAGKTQLGDMQAQIEKLQKEAFKAEQARLLDAGAAAGKVTPAMRPVLAEIADNGFLKKLVDVLPTTAAGLPAAKEARTGGSVLEQLQAIAADLQKADPKLTSAKALTLAAKKNPVLAAQYSAERAASA